MEMQSDEGRSPSSVHYAPCLMMLRGSYEGLTDAEKRVADYVLANPGRVLSLSIAEVARQSGVGFGTVARLCTKLGYAGYPDMKIALAVELLSPSYQAPERISSEDAPAAIIQKTFGFGVQSLQETAALLDPQELGRASAAIAQAQRVECYATGGLSGPIAAIVQQRLLILGVPCAVFAHNEQQVVSASLLDHTGVALGLSHSGASEPVANALALARQAGATTICVTSVPNSPVTQASDICLLMAGREIWLWSDTITSRIPMLGVLDALYAAVALEKYRRRSTSA